MEKCIATIKTGPRKGGKCGANKKVIDIIDGKETPLCNRHKIKENKDVNTLSEKLNNNLKIEDKGDNNILENDNKHDKLDGQDILNKLDEQLDELFNDYGL